VIKVTQFHNKPLIISLSYLRADGYKQAVTHIRESRWIKSMYTLQGKPDQHVTCIPRSVCVWSQTIRISHGQHTMTFRESPIDLDGSHCSWEKEIPDSIPGMTVDQFVGPHPVCLLLSTKEVVGLRQASVDSRLLGLPGPYHRYVIGMFSTCLQGANPSVINRHKQGLQPPNDPTQSQVIQSQYSFNSKWNGDWEASISDPWSFNHSAFTEISIYA
jgi:hypothetical protein